MRLSSGVLQAGVTVVLPSPPRRAITVFEPGEIEPG
jgi:hypothetical protein